MDDTSGSPSFSRGSPGVKDSRFSSLSSSAVSSVSMVVPPAISSA